ncbi:dynein axonemal light chain 4 [Diorhabda carinulata]|uniref:dynein axonemal light chain 4 n=1 Tax=Diorhabda sublineata TaxID=1163346 RepID=UPI0024E07C40|nr:dynein axonemal light chain 4 [Diorhabda sublineata]XP_057658249.1 dynein axonemal light chain 4 [Diorhabda carinulata]
MAEEEKKKEDESKKVVHTYPLVRHSDMPEEQRIESVELVVTACEKHSANNEAAARMIKEEMDKKLGPPFHVVVGEGFGFEISYECSNLLYMFFAGNLAIVIWKC